MSVPSDPHPYPSADSAKQGDSPGRQGWVDRLKGLALLWIFLNHASEHLWGAPYIGNPGAMWPPFSERWRQLLPLEGYGPWNLPLNVFRSVGWLGDQAIALFLIASGFGLVASLQKHRLSGKVSWGEFYARRLWRIYPLWWAVHLPIILRWATGRLPQGQGIQLLLSLAGLRVDATTFYQFSPSWWFIGLLLQLYLLFPLLWTLMNRLGPIRFLVGAVLATAIARGAGMAYFGSYMDPWLRGSVFITRLPEFALGMALARGIEVAPDLWEARLRRPAFVIAAAGLCVAGTALSLTWAGMTIAPFVVGLGLLGLLYPVLAAGPGGSRLGVLGWVGIHSYGIYLVHESVMFRMLAPSGVTSRVILLLIACAGLSVLIGVGLEWGVGRAARALGLGGEAPRGTAQRPPEGRREPAT